ncbi:MAG: hypothetical protein EZS28_031319 [Streblomastix strix]|uniref:Integrase catalytic domain-containing protein n=1 Tax=Streblomastix strix TaxID=222440 RepID=A0A5J4USG0_9EUKA|nr:MAG: hypothetical protein EZS28_031319 [Streblomastix strix]
MKYQEFVKNLNKQNLGKFDEKLLDKLYKQYVLKHDQSNVPRLRNKPRLHDEKHIHPEQEAASLLKASPEAASLNYPFKSKIQQYKKIHGEKPQKVQETPPDYQTKPLSKLNRPYYSPQFGSWEIDLVFSMDEHIIRANQIYLFCININTKYLVVFPLRDKSAGQIKNALQILVKNYNVTNIRGDGEKGFNGNILKTFCQENNITSFFTDSKFTNHNRVVDSVIRTIRNGFGNDSEKFAVNDLMQQMVQMYNQTPHSAYDNKFTPEQANSNHDIEGIYIRQQQNQLFEIKKQQKKQGLMSFSPGNILMIHLDYSKTGHHFVKQRRNFNELAEFIRYSNGNVVAKLLKPYSDVNIIELPLEAISLLNASREQTMFANVVDAKRQSSRFKYKTEEEALKAAEISRKHARARELLKMKVYRQFSSDSQQYLINRLRRLVVNNEIDLALMHQIVDKYDEKDKKIMEFANITDLKEAVQQKQEIIEE